MQNEISQEEFELLFEELLANEAKRQASAAVLQHENDRENDAVNGRGY